MCLYEELGNKVIVTSNGVTCRDAFKLEIRDFQAKLELKIKLFQGALRFFQLDFELAVSVNCWFRQPTDPYWLWASWERVDCL